MSLVLGNTKIIAAKSATVGCYTASIIKANSAVSNGKVLVRAIIEVMVCGMCKK